MKLINLMNRRKFHQWVSGVFVALALFPCSTQLIADDHNLVQIGVRAHSGKENAIKKWQKTADYLSEKIPGYKFKLMPLVKIDEFSAYANSKEIDFVLTNPSSYVDLEVRNGASRIATLNNKRAGAGYTQFGSVIFTRNDRDDINTLEDLKNLSFMGVAPKAFGGWRVPYMEFLNQSINPEAHFNDIKFGKTQEAVVMAVQNKEVDAGVVRTDMIERMAAKGVLKLADFKVLASKTTENFPFLHSTKLYPEWPFAKLPHVSTELAKQVAVALLTIEENHPAAQDGKYIGWSVPLNYQPVHNLLKELRVEPYDHMPDFKFGDVFSKYGLWIGFIFFIFTGISWFTFYVARLNRALARTKNNLTNEVAFRKNAENELKVYHDKLEDLVSERTQELEISNKDLEAYSYSIAHDLRTPLRSITSFSQILKKEINDRLTQDELALFDRIINAGKHMSHLTNDILELSKFSRKKLVKEEVDITGKVKEISQRVDQNNSGNVITWVIHENIIAYADPLLANILLENLINNACKYSEKKSNPEVEVGVEKINDMNCFYIKDNGIGLSKEYEDKIFKPFQRLHRQEEYEGTGIGLATVQRIVHRHGGDVWVESEPEKGAIFYFTFEPRQQSSETN